MDLSSCSAELQFAVEVVRKAAELGRRVQAGLVGHGLTKGDKSPVTVADFAIQAVVGHALINQFPGSALVAEETSILLRADAGKETLNTVTSFVRDAVPDGASSEEVCGWIDRGGAEAKGRFWVLDPVDGTKGFLRRDQYAVALALVEDGNVRLGVLGCPNLQLNGQTGVLVAAERGRGTWQTGLDGAGEFSRLRVSDCRDKQQARMLRSFEAGHTDADRIDRLAACLGTHAKPVLMDSQAKYAVLAAGTGELMLRLLSPTRPDYRERIWDQAAGSIVIEEAGGKITDLYGKSLDFTTGRTLENNRGILASNGYLHEAALEALRHAE